MLAAGGAESLKGRPHHVPPPVAEETSRCALQGLLTGDRILSFFCSDRSGWNQGAIDSRGLYANELVENMKTIFDTM